MEVGLRVIEDPLEMPAVERLQRVVWPGEDASPVPSHLLVSAIHHGGLLVGAFVEEEGALTGELVGIVFGFPGFYKSEQGLQILHYSHVLAVHPDYRDLGLGYKLKRAQWQMVRNQGLERIVWTYDPLLSRNANLNIAKLGAVCNTYIDDYYGEMRDGLNIGLASDRFKVDWWVNSPRVNRRLSRQARKSLDLAHYLAAGAIIVNPSRVTESGLPAPVEPDLSAIPLRLEGESAPSVPLLLVEIPADFLGLKAQDLTLAHEWRMHTRSLFSDLFSRGYLVTDFVHLPGTQPRSFYLLSHGDLTL
ncbi:MAG: GNAT family N-acetyltransferase [Anaerolineales bacterium]|nr:GNAT family N-acetyltransferase [Anaerolineales bacterium]